MRQRWRAAKRYDRNYSYDAGDDVSEFDLGKVEVQLSGLLDDSDFQALNRQLGKFNLFEALGAERGELRHSNFLSFVLSPTKPHGLGDELLRRFIKLVIAKMQVGSRPVSSLEIAVADLDSTIVERERDDIDILLEIPPPLNMIVIVENKIGASEARGQLAKYKRSVAQRFNNHRRLHVFLTPTGKKASDADFVPCSYAELAEVIARLVDEQAQYRTFPDETKVILEHYVSMLRRNVVDDEQLRNLARQLYARYSEAFDFISASKPQQDEILAVVRREIEATEDLTFDRQGTLMLRFVPTKWNDIDLFNICPIHRWTKTGRNLLFELRGYRNSGRVGLGLIVGPAEAPFRKFLWSWASSHPDVFKGLVKPMGEKTSSIFVLDLVSAKAAEQWEDAEIQEKLLIAWKDFYNNLLPRIEKSLEEALSEMKDKNPDKVPLS
jgi:PD-(D/E)XK nuclease superfamily